ncbi:hypothetical protein CGCF415_v011616 [Colletotrichum fructicola]|uniref:Uncharacterized protein n=1 Tax=Colletotrichum siamense TaxID=690259 RepID=A0A9P5EI71_COLSI|nr:hypothetical protein CGCSCA5_v001945 [Colletotrichum siamense]KAF4831902.1 hypothetical protein CGCTS75_v004748 [Colletotrichum tropicale]KAF4896279.1 hypothetical protein CGCF415_v011616 [Colletotrichum fructicola]KAF5506863.1 hypothetical protein CGCA056_v013782 [Colletotrichum aenigma]KAF4832213.1 hypothetical protein CGCSCA4_v013768 [Colletotrichum siamense]
MWLRCPFHGSRLQPMRRRLSEKPNS